MKRWLGITLFIAALATGYFLLWKNREEARIPAEVSPSINMEAIDPMPLTKPSKRAPVEESKPPQTPQLSERPTPPVSSGSKKTLSPPSPPQLLPLGTPTPQESHNDQGTLPLPPPPTHLLPFGATTPPQTPPSKDRLPPPSPPAIDSKGEKSRSAREPVQ